MTLLLKQRKKNKQSNLSNNSTYHTRLHKTMTSILYSTTCYIKNDHYRLSICTDNDQSISTTVQFDTESSEFTSTEIPLEKILPALTRLNFELINNKKNTTISKTIILNHLLSVQQTTQTFPRKFRKYFTNNKDLSNTNETTTPVNEGSSRPTLYTNISEENIDSQTPVADRQSSFKRFFSSQTHLDSESNLITTTVIHINYIDVSNSIRWSVKRLKLYFETEDIANELHTNLNLCLSVLEQRPRNLLAFINPFGGKGEDYNYFV